MVLRRTSSTILADLCRRKIYFCDLEVFVDVPLQKISCEGYWTVHSQIARKKVTTGLGEAINQWQQRIASLSTKQIVAVYQL